GCFVGQGCGFYWLCGQDDLVRRLKGAAMKRYGVSSSGRNLCLKSPSHVELSVRLDCDESF
ncbi:unnamed protein product, partial [Brassica oleracea]